MVPTREYVVNVREHSRTIADVVRAINRRPPATVNVNVKPVNRLKQFFLDAEELATKQYAKDVRIGEFRRACERQVAKLEAEKAELASQAEQVYGKQETWDSTHRAIFDDCKVYAARLNAYEKKRKAEKKAEGTFTKKAKASPTATASAPNKVHRCATCNTACVSCSSLL
jgi:uncharacterized protein with PIN domain